MKNEETMLQKISHQGNTLQKMSTPQIAKKEVNKLKLLQSN